MKFRGGSISIKEEGRSLLVLKPRVMTKKARGGSGAVEARGHSQGNGDTGGIDPDLGRELGTLEGGGS